MALFNRLHKFIKDPAYIPAYWRRFIREFRIFDFDYKVLNGYSLPPKSICFILTEHCNLQCVMCDIGQRNANLSSGATFPIAESVAKGEEIMTLEDWKALIDDIVKKHWNPLLLLTGTEPFLYQDVNNLIEYIVAKGLRLHITTNGTLLSRFADHLVALCKKPDSIDITISLDGIGEVHDTIRGITGTFDKAIDGLKSITEKKREHGQKWPEVSICYTISNYNCDHMGEFVQWFNHKDFDLKSITFSHLWFKDEAIVKKHNNSYGELFPVKQENLTGLDIAAIPMERVHSQLRSIRQASRHLPFSIAEHPQLTYEEAQKYYSKTTESVFYDRCRAPWRNVAITPGGEVIITPMCFDYPLGNVKKDTFSHIWNDTPLKTFRRKLKNAGSYPACVRCCLLFDSKPKFYKLKDLI
jgi:MoaA/NifB/PqqE/SkfB family radical SAM enzyme